ncbi:beta-ketoacyl synthase N-terminal-like domain-containing protein [Streptomyces toxytricini]|uniref:Beta-ketoacyl synthase N-terminal-like domain-containing protein n=1 Tax=Streptomyces toxytricini TaxID=67369 RepID=A0ABW8EM48_STRT5
MAVHVHDYLTTPEPAGDGGAWTTPRPTLPEVFTAAVAAGGDRAAVVDAGGARSWQAWRADADAFGRALQDLGVRPGDVVAAQLPNSWEFLVAHVAVASVGAVLLPLHSTLGTREAGSLLERTEARALLLPAAAEPPARSALPALEFVIPVGPDAAGAADSYEALVRARRGLAPQPVPVTADMPLVLMPSSGTTSARPKICIHTHGGLLGNAVTAAREGGTSARDTFLSASPFTHLFGLFSVHLSLVTAARQAVLPRWDTGAFRDLAAASGASVLVAVPAQLRDLVESPDPVGRLREVRTGGAAVPASLVAGVRSALGAATVVQWGMSEVGAGLSTAPDDPVGVAARSIGRPVGEGRVRVVGEDGRPCPVGETGELEFHGPSLFRGYLADPEATAEAMTADGWLRTGDLACRYEDGTIGYRGRQAERINVGGLKFTASEVEALLADLPQLANAAVAARPDDRLGEYPVLLAQLRTGARLTLEDVRAHLAAKGVAAYKWPLELVTVAEVPVTPTRKVARGRLAALLALPARKTVAAWAQQAAALPEREALDAALALVRELTAEVGGAALGAADGGRSFRSAGLDSLGAVRLASGLGARTGLALSTTAVFDHPTPEQLARHLVDLAAGAADGPADAAADPARHAAPALTAAPAAGRGGDGDDPIAVVGIGCRFPGGITSPGDLWRLLSEGGETVGPFPADRGWDLDRVHHPDRGRAGTSYVRHGGFLDGAADFDAAFFGLSPREARAMDPQQRLLLETAWEALERAGIPPAALRGTAAGVFVGLMSSDYAPRLNEAPELHDGLLLTGNASSVAAGRIAYTLGLTGPALTVDTACSSSLVALHLARQALLRGECTVALAGGATVMSTPASFVDFSRQGALSPDGRCRAFSAAADGAGWSEGAGVLVLERLSAARRAGRPVLAVLSGSAVNQDGASNGLTAPSGPAQREVVRLALADAGLAPADVDLVEAHGTGTPLGDRIEAEALLASYGRGRDADRPVWLGSLKSNIGHTQAAAGVAGVIKAVLALRHGEMPRSLHAGEPTPHVGWAAGGVRLLDAPRPWPRPADGRRRAAGVSAFGISGTNAHVLVQDPPAAAADEPETGPRDTAGAPAGPEPAAAVPWVLAAKDRTGLRALAARLARSAAGAAPADVARALVVHRAPGDRAFPRRAVVVGDGSDALRAGLADLAAGRENPCVVTGAPPAAGAGRTVFVFPGQGAQWEAMGAALLREAPVFAEAVRACDAAFAPHLDWSAAAVLRGEPGTPPADRVDVAQTALFTMMVSLAALWRSYGVEPDAVVGHSQGEIAAAYAAGALTLEDAARVVALRARAVRRLPPGAMAAVSLPAPELAARLAGRAGPPLAVAAENAPDASVVAGEPAAVDALLAELAAEGVRGRRVAVDYASHCAAVEPLRAELAEGLAGLAPRPVSTPFRSTAGGGRIAGPELTADYWYRNLRNPVAFAPAVASLLESGFRTFVEVSPHPVLTYAVQATAERAGAEVLAAGSLRRGDGGLGRFLLSAAEVYAHGAAVDWAAACGGRRPGPVEALPTYPFQRRRYWLAAPGPTAPAAAPDAALPDDAANAAGEPRTTTGAAGPPHGTADAPHTAAAEGPRSSAELLAFVRESAAAVLGYAGADAVDPDRPFLELGAGSLAAVELRGRLARALELSLPSTVAFDHPTARALAAHLGERLEHSRPRDGAPAAPEARPAPERAGDRDPAGPAEPTAPAALPDGLSALFRHASAEGRGAVAADVLSEASLLRPSFTAAEAADRAQDPVRLAGGPAGPALVCLPSLVPTGGPHEYARLAAAFAGRRTALALPQPGFGPGEALPADLPALVEAHVAALGRRTGEGPVLLCGHSSGGWTAWAVAARLAREGRPAAGVVLLDTPWYEGTVPSEDLSLVLAVAERRRREAGDTGAIGTHRLTATGGYLRLLRGWRPGPLGAPVLVVRAREPIGPPAPWRHPHTAAEVPGDHFTMMEAHAGEIAAAVESWLAGPRGAAGPASPARPVPAGGTASAARGRDVLQHSRADEETAP